MPHNQLFTDNSTFINFVGLAFTGLMGVLLLVLPRRLALLPVLALVCYMTMGMRIMVADLNFTMIRILLLFGWTRLLLRREVRRMKLNAIDSIVLWWAAVAIVTHTLLWQYDGFKYKLGVAYTALGFYFLFRFLIRDLKEISQVCKILAILLVFLAAAMLREKVTGTNVFAVFGGVSEQTIMRNGTLRCQGPFSHPILAGTFGATLLPLVAGLWWERGFGRALSIIGVAAAGTIVLTAGSSGPILAAIVGFMALFFWSVRRHMRTFRWAVVAVLIGLELTMKVHVWFLIARVGVVNGSDAWHRAYLIDRAVANLQDWWLIGTRTPAAWGDPSQQLYDVTNQYIANGVDGGLITMLLFIAILVRCFRGVGRSARVAESLRDKRFIWAIGAALTSHAVSFMSVAYFDQNVVNWYLLLAMISTACAGLLDCRLRVPRPAPQARKRKLEATGVFAYRNTATVRSATT
jgi:hypothetical protein